MSKTFRFKYLKGVKSQFFNTVRNAVAGGGVWSVKGGGVRSGAVRGRKEEQVIKQADYS